jgi:hypothetical protein
MNKYLKNISLVIFSFAGLTTINIRSGPPEASISNGIVNVQLYLPDASKGYYRGTRFDWAGVMPSVEYKGHQYHGKWFDTYNPTTHDAIMGPVEEFAPLGFTEAKTGETFVKIGVGRLVKADDSQYAFHKFYKLSDPGKWKIRKKSNQVAFTHSLNDINYAYEYEKTVLLTPGKAEMVLLHTLKNKGKRTIETTVYDHNFFVIDKEPTGPGYVVSYPVRNLSAEGGKGVGEILTLQENQIIYLRSLVKGEQGYFPDLGAGMEMTYDIGVENIKTGAGVKIKGDRPVSKMVFWSSPTTVSPEPYIKIKVEPGKAFTWKIAYEYYTIQGK